MTMNFLNHTDPTIATLIQREQQRQEQTLMLIPSENHASKAVEEAVGSVLGNKYAEGYPGKRYYQGQEYVDQIEQLAIDRAKKLFQVPHVNVQAYSGSPANTAIMFALLEPGDTVMGLALDHGGHLTHGHPKVTFSGKYFRSVPYQVKADGQLDYQALAKQVKEVKPKMLIAGTTAYPRELDFAKFRQIADSVDAWLLADISHIAGLVVAGVHPSPAEYAHVIMSTTHKSLRAARGALIMATDSGLERDPKLGQRLDKAVFPGLQGGPHLSNIAGIAVGLAEAESPLFTSYARQVVENAQALAESLSQAGLDLVSGGTDNHLLVVDVRKTKYSGKEAAVLLEKAGLVCNYNTIPFDPKPPFNPSGIRLGTPAVTSRGMKLDQMKEIGDLIAGLLMAKLDTDSARQVVLKLCQEFPVKEAYLE